MDRNPEPTRRFRRNIDRGFLQQITLDLPLRPFLQGIHQADLDRRLRDRKSGVRFQIVSHLNVNVLQFLYRPDRKRGRLILARSGENMDRILDLFRPRLRRKAAPLEIVRYKNHRPALAVCPHRRSRHKYGQDNPDPNNRASTVLTRNTS